MSEPAHRRQLTSTVYATPLMNPTTALGLFIRLFMFELRETGDWDIFRLGSLSREVPSFSPTFLTIFAQSDTKKICFSEFGPSFLFFSLFSFPSFSLSQPKNRKKSKKSDIRHSCLVSDCSKKTRGRRLISDKIGKTETKSGLEIGRGSGLTPVACSGSGAKASPPAARPVPLNGRGRRLVELTNGC